MPQAALRSVTDAGGDQHRQDEAEAVHDQVPLAAVDQLAAVEAAGGRADHGVPFHRLRVHDPRGRLRVPAFRLADAFPQPVVELPDQSVVAPASEERIDPVPGREVRRHRPPLDPVVDQIPHRVDHLPVAVALRPASPAVHPCRDRQHRPHHGPLRVRHVRRVARPAARFVGRVPEPVSKTVTPRGEQAGLHRNDHVQLRQQGLLALGLRQPRAVQEALPSCSANRELTRSGPPFEPAGRAPISQKGGSRSPRPSLCGPQSQGSSWKGSMSVTSWPHASRAFQATRRLGASLLVSRMRRACTAR